MRQYAAELLGDRDAEVAGAARGSWAHHGADRRWPGIAHDDAWCEAFDRLAVEVRGALGRGARDDDG